MLVFVYAIARPAVGYGSDAANIAILVALAVLHVLVGWLIGRWWAVLLPLLIVPLAIPAGTPSVGEDPLPVWFGLAMIVAPIGAVLIGIAAALRRLSLEPARR